MAKFCGKTCGTCKEGGAAAQDCPRDNKSYANECVGWSDDGYCEQGSEYLAFMLANCASSCGDCASSTATAAPTTSNQSPQSSESVKTTGSTKATQATDTSPTRRNDCWIANSGISDRAILLQTEFSSMSACLDECKATSSCKAVMVSPSYHVYRECFLLGEDEVGTRSGWTAAVRLCFQPEYNGDEICGDSERYALDCPDWAGSYCSSGEYVDFMSLNCKGSCGLCEVEVGVDEEECEDNEDFQNDCVDWARDGYCTDDTYVDWMSRNCKKSCDTCAGMISCADAVEHMDYCGGWSDMGYCESGSYLTFMQENCRMTCGLCEEDESDGQEQGQGQGQGKGQGKGGKKAGKGGKGKGKKNG